MSNTRDTLRNALLGKKHTFRRTTVTDKETGAVYEVRQPSIKERSDLRKEVTTITPGKGNSGGIDFDFFRFMIMAAVRFTVVPGTDERVFCDEDFDALVTAPAGDFIDELAQAAANLCNVDEDQAEAAKKLSEETQNDN
jgi:hypothetical protein